MNSLFLILILIFATTKIKDKNICKCVYGVIAILIFNQLYDGYCNFVEPDGYTMIDSNCSEITSPIEQNARNACDATPGCFYDNSLDPSLHGCRAINPNDKISSEKLSAAYQCDNGGTPGLPQAYSLGGGTWSADMTLSGTPLDTIPDTCNSPDDNTTDVLTLASCTQTVANPAATTCEDYSCPAGFTSIAANSSTDTTSMDDTDKQAACCEEAAGTATCVDFAECPDNRPLKVNPPTGVETADVDTCCQPAVQNQDSGSDRESCSAAKSRTTGDGCGPNGFKYDTSLFSATQRRDFSELLLSHGDLSNVAKNLEEAVCEGPVCDLTPDAPDFETCCKSQMPCYLHFKALESADDATKVYINDTGQGVRTGGPIGDNQDLVALTCPGQNGRPKIDNRDFQNISIPMGFDGNQINANPDLSNDETFSTMWQELAGKLCQGSTCNFNNGSLDLNTCCQETVNCKEDVLNQTPISNWFKPELLDSNGNNKLTRYLTGFDQEDGNYQELSSLDDLCLDPLQTNPSLRTPANIMQAEENVRKHLRRFKSEYPPFDATTGANIAGDNLPINNDFFNDSICGSANSETDNLFSRSHITNDEVLSQCCDTALVVDSEDDIDPTETACGPVLKVIGT